MNDDGFSFELDPRLEHLDAERKAVEKKLQDARALVVSEHEVLAAMQRELESHTRKAEAERAALRSVPREGTEVWIARRDHLNRLLPFLQRSREHVDEQRAKTRSAEVKVKTLGESLDRLLIEVRTLEDLRERALRSHRKRERRRNDERREDDHLPRWFLDS